MQSDFFVSVILHKSNSAMETLNPLVWNGKEPELWNIANEVVDPEIPVLTVVDMGIVRDVIRAGDNITVKITPTYSGCPAMEMISTDIKVAFHRKGFNNVSIEFVLSPSSIIVVNPVTSNLHHPSGDVIGRTCCFPEFA